MALLVSVRASFPIGVVDGGNGGRRNSPTTGACLSFEEGAAGEVADRPRNGMMVVGERGSGMSRALMALVVLFLMVAVGESGCWWRASELLLTAMVSGEAGRGELPAWLWRRRERRRGSSTARSAVGGAGITTVATVAAAALTAAVAAAAAAAVAEVVDVEAAVAAEAEVAAAAGTAAAGGTAAAAGTAVAVGDLTRGVGDVGDLAVVAVAALEAFGENGLTAADRVSSLGLIGSAVREFPLKLCRCTCGCCACGC